MEDEFTNFIRSSCKRWTPFVVPFNSEIFYNAIIKHGSSTEEWVERWREVYLLADEAVRDSG